MKKKPLSNNNNNHHLFCLDYVIINSYHVLDSDIITHQQYWQIVEEERKKEELRKKEEEKEQAIQAEREELWRNINEIKKQIDKNYNETVFNALEQSINRKLNEIQKHADYLCSSKNASGFKIRKLEEYVEVIILNKSHADLYVSHFLEFIFGKSIHTESRFRKIEKIMDYAGPLKYNTSSTINSVKRTVKAISALSLNKNHFCSTCWKVYDENVYDTSHFGWFPYIYGDSCKYKKEGQPCNHEQVKCMSKYLTSSVIQSFKDQINDIRGYENEADYYLNQIKIQLPFYEIVIDFKKIGYFIVLLIVLIFLIYVIPIIVSL